MKLYDHQPAGQGWSYWGDSFESEVGLTMGFIAKSQDFKPDTPHYHETGAMYLLVLEGAGTFSVNGSPNLVKPNQVLYIEPGEVYHHAEISQFPFRWIAFCSSNDPKDKVVLGIDLDTVGSPGDDDPQSKRQQ